MKQTLLTSRPLFLALFLTAVCTAGLFGNRKAVIRKAEEWFHAFGIRAAGYVMKDWFPAAEKEEENNRWLGLQPILLSYLKAMEDEAKYSGDPAYERMIAIAKENRRAESAAGQRSDKESGEVIDRAEGEERPEQPERDGAGGQETEAGRENAEKEQGQTGGEGENGGESLPTAVRTANLHISPVIREKLADYDYLMNTFYSVHPTTTAGRDMMQAERFLDMDLSMEKNKDTPQILIYHTHSQEEFSDWSENPEATIVNVGAYLAELLEARGYGVIHDKTVYDVHEGTLDRSRAYTYALDGITGILQEHPEIQVVLDIHRDGVKEGTRLVTEINGKPTAKIMFFNGTSQTPDGPIEYLKNPNREANLAFSFQLQMAAAGQFPGFTRKIYLKGLRYNQHVRARSALIEVGAQTNTFEEAKNAMEPLTELLEEVLGG